MSKPKNKLSQISLDSGYTTARFVGVSLLQLLSYVMIARIFGTEGNGVFTLSILLPGLLLAFLNLGIPSSVVYFTQSSKIPETGIRDAVQKLRRIIIVLGICIGVVLVSLHEVVFPDVPVVCLVGALLVFPLGVIQAFGLATLQARSDFVSYNKVLIVQPAVFVLCLLSLLYPNQAGIEIAVAMYLVSFIPSIFLLWKALKKITLSSVCENVPAEDHSSEDTHSPRSDLTTILWYGAKNHFSNVLAFLNYRLDIFLINFFIGPAAVGIYAVSVLIGERLWILSQSVSLVLLPKLSALKNDSRHKKVLCLSSMRIVLVATVLGAIVVTAIGKPVIQVLFGKSFLSAYWCLLIMLPGIVAMAGARILSNDIAARGRPELNAYTSVVTISVNLTLNILFIPAYGIYGAALATTVAYTANYVFRILVYSHVASASIQEMFHFTLSEFKLR